MRLWLSGESITSWTWICFCVCFLKTVFVSESLNWMIMWQGFFSSSLFPWSILVFLFFRSRLAV